jgi:hypothetical protein
MTLRNTMVQLVDYRDLEGIVKDNELFACSDIDMIYERKGKFLVAEWKKPNEQLSEGQSILLKALAKNDEFTVIKVCGYSENKKLIVYDFNWLRPNGTWAFAGQGKQRLIEFIQNWYAKADNVQK